ncbi:MAG: integration host factor subunit beta [Chromatiaceae bacterium]|nr:integration host factor subunit beta [Chromatiaceae bacterium]MCF8004125.1 integration host factor subunit beta [Chromatiaceae bacterium]
MLLSELTATIARQQADLPAADVELAIAALIETMTEALAAGERIELRGFGAFSLRMRQARVGRNPKTGEPVSVPVRQALHFKPGKALRERVNAGLEPGALD